MSTTRIATATVETDAATAIARYHRDQHGHFPDDVRAYLLGDMLIVRCSGTFSRQENELAGSREGRKLIQSARREMQADLRDELHALIEPIVGCRVIRSFYDIDVRSGDEAKVFILARPVDEGHAEVL
jgi:uncharacterized protein YbcI